MIPIQACASVLSGKSSPHERMIIMKKKKSLRILGTFFLLILLSGCTLFEPDPVLRSLPRYRSKAFYTSGGFQDYTDYARYAYRSVSTRQLESSPYFSPVTAENTDELLLYIDDFEGWVRISGGELLANYDFERFIISEGDYCCIKSRFGEPIGQSTYGKFDSYNIYLFDFDTQTLYYFHNNI